MATAASPVLHWTREGLLAVDLVSKLANADDKACDFGADATLHSAGKTSEWDPATSQLRNHGKTDTIVEAA